MLGIGIGISINNAIAVMEGLFGKPSEFTRTPKYRIEGAGDDWKTKIYKGKTSWAPYVELALACYFTFVNLYAADLRPRRHAALHRHLPVGLPLHLRDVAGAEPRLAGAARAGGLSPPGAAARLSAGARPEVAWSRLSRGARATRVSLVARSGRRAWMATIDTDAQSAGVRRVLWITLGLNLGVSAGKVIVGHLSGSLAMVADGYHSLVDGSNNVIGLIVAAFAFRPPDRSHPYGHRKFETAATARDRRRAAGRSPGRWCRVPSAARRGRRCPRSASSTGWSWRATIAVNLGVSWYEAREGRRLQSAFLVADATHTRADLYVSLGVVASFVAALLGLGWADPLVALAIGAIIAWQAIQILRSAFNVLTDRAAIPVDRIEALAASVPGVLRVHDARTRGRRDFVYVDLTAHLDGGAEPARGARRRGPHRGGAAGRAPGDRGRGRPPRARGPRGEAPA